MKCKIGNKISAVGEVFYRFSPLLNNTKITPLFRSQSLYYKLLFHNKITLLFIVQYIALLKHLTPPYQSNKPKQKTLGRYLIFLKINKMFHFVVGFNFTLIPFQFYIEIILLIKLLIKISKIFKHLHMRTKKKIN